jgi:hypothetical protein
LFKEDAMSSEQQVKSLMDLASAGFLWGPFFFAVFFMVVITASAHQCYSKVLQRVSPPPSEAEIADYRSYFRLSIRVGILLVFISVGWWLYAQWKTDKDHAFQGVVIGLEINQNLVASEEDFYTREVSRKVGVGLEVKDYHFAVVRTAPFSSGQKFTLKFYPEPGAVSDEAPKAVELEMPYSGIASGRFRIKRGGDNKFQLVSLGNNPEKRVSQ